ncbi:T9SS type A sorting domain-containing protein [Chitinophagales bacterium]|nr:T9SS type A sorting domain-containing protein [Chitinophagales bacterium]
MILNRKGMRFITQLFLILFCSISIMGQENTEAYSFFVAGHVYGKPGSNNEGFYPAFKDMFSYIQSRSEIKFGVLTGDIVSANPVVTDWEEVDADILTLGLPVHFAVGNHDMENRPVYEERYGSTYYHFRYESDLFIVLDPNLDNWNISGDQLQFLSEVLREEVENNTNVFVFFHQLLWRGSHNEFNYITWNSGAGRDGDVNFWTDVEPMFNCLSNRVVMFAGDLGASWSTDVTYDSYDNITLIASGMGSDNGDNFIVVNVDSLKSVAYDLVCLEEEEPYCLGALTDFLMVSEVDTELTDWCQREFKVFPNPVVDYLTIRTNNLGATSIKLYNGFGEIVLNYSEQDQNEFSVYLGSLVSGVYYLKVFNGGNVESSKIVVR